MLRTPFAGQKRLSDAKTTLFYTFYDLKIRKKLCIKKLISTSKQRAEHPFTGRNTQHQIILKLTCKCVIVLFDWPPLGCCERHGAEVCVLQTFRGKCSLQGQWKVLPFPLCIGIRFILAKVDSHSHWNGQPR